MTFGNLGFKIAARASNKHNKAQAVDKGAYVAQGHTKVFSDRFVKAKLKLKQRCQKTAGAVQRRANAKPITTVDNTTDFTIPPIDLAQSDLCVIAADYSDTVQHTVAIDPLPTHPAKSIGAVNTFVPVSEHPETDHIAVAPCTSSTPILSVSEQDGVDRLSPYNSASSSATALSLYATTTTSAHDLTEPRILQANSATETSTKQCPLPSVSFIVEPTQTELDSAPAKRPEPTKAMTKKYTKARQQKIIEALHKLKTKLWPWNHRKDSSIEPDDDGIIERCQWEIITNIERTTIVEVVRRTLSTYGYRDPAIRVVGTAQGTYHFVFNVKTLSLATEKIEGWVVKIPGYGTPDRWTKEDEYMLVQEVETMRLLSEYTTIPSPQVSGYSATLGNDFGFPYIVMKELPGKSATDLWFEQHGEVPSPETERRRLTFLRSLARYMTELNKLPFKQIGMPTYNMEDPDFYDIFDRAELEQLPVKKYYVWPFCDSFRSVERGPFASTQAYTRHARDEEQLPVPGKNGKFDYNQLQQLGLYKVLDIVFAHPVFHSTPEETFTLRHSDLDVQNILIDVDGNITGILDWDGSISMPRCVGHASVPHFTDRDFYPDAAIKSLFLSWRANHYRNTYAAALVEAGNPDAKYTTKSHIYQAAFAALYEGTDPLDFVYRLLREIPGLQMETDHLMALIGKGCKLTEEMLKTEIWKVLEPEMPSGRLLQDIEQQHADALLQACMEDFAGFTANENTV